MCPSVRYRLPTFISAFLCSPSLLNTHHNSQPVDRFQYHKTGVLCGALHQQSKYIITAGFESHALVWMLKSPDSEPFLLTDKQHPHMDHIMGVHAVQDTPQVARCLAPPPSLREQRPCQSNSACCFRNFCKDSRRALVGYPLNSLPLGRWFKILVCTR